MRQNGYLFRMGIAMKAKIRWMLMLYDLLIYLACALLVLVIYPSSIDKLTPLLIVEHTAVGSACLFIFRIFFKVYKRVWRYAGPGEYMRLIFSDALASVTFLLIRYMFPRTLTFVRGASLFMLTLLGSITMRLGYQWLYQRRNSGNQLIRKLLRIVIVLGGLNVADERKTSRRIRVAIVGAGSVGAALADELLHNPKALYVPTCFVDIDKGTTGREIYGIPIYQGDEQIGERFKRWRVQEVVFALPNVTSERRLELYSLYKDLGYNIKVYDYPLLNEEEGGKRQLHDFNIEDLLFRTSNNCLNEETRSWFRGKSVLITGGGGSIGSELARQIARCNPSRLVILDVYENGAYDIQQELRIRYGEQLNLRLEIANVCDKEHLEKIFREHTPDIVLHAAAHKHVPLMERNVLEAVRNNIFGTLNVVEVCEKYGVKRFIMISTDKAVNPTNVMGATKRMCEMIVQSRSGETTSFSATRFGNVLGSNGSVIPLFRRQIAEGGPVTVTDKRIIRYFMTIPEASQLVMTSGAMAKNGELYVLDMGKPVKILDLAENMIRLSGLEPYRDIDIIETGLRPGEKLYEELLIKSEDLDKTDNEMIFVERDRPLGQEAIAEKLEILREALKSQSNRVVKQALMDVVPTYHTPEEVNEAAIEAAKV